MIGREQGSFLTVNERATFKIKSTESFASLSLYSQLLALMQND